MSYIDNPVFICGHRKAGTTLLINLMDGIEDAIVYPDDSGFFYMYFPTFCKNLYSDEEKLSRLLDRIAKENLKEVIDRQKTSIENKNSLYQKQDEFIKKLQCFQQPNFSTKQLLEHFIRSFGETFQGNKTPKFWMEKTTSSEIYALELKEMFPNAKFIHIIRDPRDNWSSMLSGWDKRYVNYNQSKQHLLNSMIERGKLGFQMAIDNLTNIGSTDYLILKYEELVNNPIVVMQNIANFLNVSFSEILLSPSTFGIPWAGNNFDEKSFSGISSSSVGQWKSKVERSDAMLIEYYFRDAMNEFGYNVEFNLVSCQRAASEHYKWSNFSTGTNSDV